MSEMVVASDGFEHEVGITTVAECFDCGATATAATAAIQVGAVVRYHGSITTEHYATFYVAEIYGPRLSIIDREYPAVGILTNVHPGHVTPTGEMVDLCACGHEVSLYLRSEAHFINEPTTCGAQPCSCVTHGPKDVS